MSCHVPPLLLPDLLLKMVKGAKRKLDREKEGFSVVVVGVSNDVVVLTILQEKHKSTTKRMTRDKDFERTNLFAVMIVKAVWLLLG
ncbi:hypothetical protein D3C80_2034310 [compost metagenome]